MRTTVLEYMFLQDFFIANKGIYEQLLCECLNKSIQMSKFVGGNFTLIDNQENGQADVVSNDTGYEIDFKLMISETLKEYQVLSAPIIKELEPSIKAAYASKPIKKKVVLLQNACRDITEQRLNELRGKHDMESKAVVHFFDKVLNKPKNILLFIPLYITTINKDLSPEEQFDLILSELSQTMRYIYEFRHQKQSEYDTFLIYLINIPQCNQFELIITKFTAIGLDYIDTVPLFSLKTAVTLAQENIVF